MSVPGLVAEASFAKANGHNPTSRNTIHVRTQRIGSIGPAPGVSDETIDVTIRGPGSSRLARERISSASIQETRSVLAAMRVLVKPVPVVASRPMWGRQWRRSNNK